MYKCNYCKKEFKLKSSKTNHEKRHFNKKYYKDKIICEICKREFRSIYNKEKHKKFCDGSGLTRKEKNIKNKENNKGKTFKEILIQKGTYIDFCEKIKKSMLKLGKEGKLTGKGLTKEIEINRKKKISETMKLKKLGGYRKGSGRGKQGRYKGIWCDSSWELAWVIYHLDHNISFERNWKKFEYKFNGEIHTYTPDFKIGNEFIEVKGYMTEQAQEKINQFPYKIKIMGEKELKPIIEYVENKYGKKYISFYD